MKPTPSSPSPESVEKEIYFRIAPALLNAGLMTFREIDATLRQSGLEFKARDIRAMAKQDAWMTEEGLLS